MAHGQRLLPVDVQGIEEFLGVALVAVDATVAAELFEGEASETRGGNRTSMDFLVDFSANLNNKHHFENGGIWKVQQLPRKEETTFLGKVLMKHVPEMNHCCPFF